MFERNPQPAVGDGATPSALPDLDSFEGVLDLFEEHAYRLEVGSDGRARGVFSGPKLARLLGGAVPAGVDPVDLWRARVHPADAEAYDTFFAQACRGEAAEGSYRLIGLDGVTRVLWDRARATGELEGRMTVSGVVSDMTLREATAVRLDEASDRFTRLLDVVGAHVYLALGLPDGTLEEHFQGPGADRLLGGALPDHEMENWDAAVHRDDRLSYDAFNAKLSAGEDADVEYRLIGADGITRWVHDRAATRLRQDGVVEVSGIVSEVTERRRLLDAMRDAHAELELAHSEAELRARTDDLTGALNRRYFAERVAAELARADDRCGLLLLDVDHFKHVNDVYGHVAGDAVLVALARLVESSLEPGDCLARWGGEEFGVLLREIGSEEQLAQRAGTLQRAVAEAPISAGDVTLKLTISIGAVRASSEIATLDALMEAVDRCLYAAKRSGRNRVRLLSDIELDPAPASEPEALSIARALIFAASSRESTLEAHAERVASLAGLTAVELALSAAGVFRCQLAGWLHDVGKIAIPDSVLSYPGPLDDEQWGVMRTHPVVGEEIVRRIPVLSEVATAVRHHHELYGGGGYPDGLMGAEIPIEARIVAVADAFATMTVDRVYASARSPEAGAAELRRSAGTHFDPVIVEALLSSLGYADRQAREAA